MPVGCSDIAYLQLSHVGPGAQIVIYVKFNQFKIIQCFTKSLDPWVPEVCTMPTSHMHVVQTCLKIQTLQTFVLRWSFPRPQPGARGVPSSSKGLGGRKPTGGIWWVGQWVDRSVHVNRKIWENHLWQWMVWQWMAMMIYMAMLGPSSRRSMSNQRIPADTSRYQQIPADTSGYQRIPTDTSG